VARQIRTAVVIVTLLVPVGWFVTNAGGTPGTRGLSTLRPGTLAAIPGVGRLIWTCDAQRRVAATFIAGRPLVTQRVTLTGDGRRLSSATLGVKNDRLGSRPGHWKELTFRVMQTTEPGSVVATLTVRFRVLSGPTRQCLVPLFSVAVRTRSHAVGG
jgi:hypothetical protein